MSNRLAKALVVLVETGSFSGAVKKFFQRPSAVRITINNREKGSGLKLHSRIKYHIGLKVTGKGIYYKAKKVLQLSKERVDLIMMQTLHPLQQIT
ncbi:MAG: LysR family transcriptional regulator [Proteobacteria bacterium]|nr:LysR family transcriptional regulator [Pseudomonadota bacterium]